MCNLCCNSCKNCSLQLLQELQRKECWTYFVVRMCMQSGFKRSISSACCVGIFCRGRLVGPLRLSFCDLSMDTSCMQDSDAWSFIRSYLRFYLYNSEAISNLRNAHAHTHHTNSRNRPHPYPQRAAALVTILTKARTQNTPMHANARGRSDNPPTSTTYEHTRDWTHAHARPYTHAHEISHRGTQLHYTCDRTRLIAKTTQEHPTRRTTQQIRTLQTKGTKSTRATLTHKHACSRPYVQHAHETFLQNTNTFTTSKRIRANRFSHPYISSKGTHAQQPPT